MQPGFEGAMMNNTIYYQPILEKEGYIKAVDAGKPCFYTKRQLGSSLERETLVQFVSANIPANALQSTGSTPCDIIINRRSRYKADGMILSWTVSVANSPVTLAPAPLQIDHVETAFGGGSKLAQTQYGVQLLEELMALSEEQLSGVAPLIGMTPDFLSSLNYIPAGSSKTFFLPLISNLIPSSKLYLGGINDDIRIRTYFTMGVESGTASNVTLTAMSVWLISKDLPESEDMELEKFYLNNTICFPYLNHVRLQNTNTFNAGTQYTIPNNNAIVGMCPFATQHWRSSTSNTSAGARTFQYLGDNGYWYIADASGVNIWSSSNLPPALTRFIMSAYNVPSKIFDKLSIIPILPGEPSYALQGSKEGGFWYANGKEQFIFYPGINNETAEVQTLATYYNVGTRTASTPTSGNYTISFRGSQTTELAYNASASTILSALQALASVQADNITLAVSASLSTSGSFTVTISNMPGRVPSLSGGIFQINTSTLSDGTHSLFGETAITTQGVLGNYIGAGWANGTYTYEVDAWVWARVQIVNGDAQVYQSV